MNKSPIEWTDYTWNPVTGCKNDCFYCYARRISKRFKRSFEPTFHPERLEQPLKVKKPARIFVCSMAELFGPWVPQKWIKEILAVVGQSPWHTFIFLTKHPRGLNDIEFPGNVWIGVTQDNDPRKPNAGAWAHFLDKVDAPIKFVSFEPLLGAPGNNLLLNGVDWVIIGALTGSGAQRWQPAEWMIKRILDRADYYSLPVFMKDNLAPYWDGDLRQEFPEGLVLSKSNTFLLAAQKLST